MNVSRQHAEASRPERPSRGRLRAVVLAVVLLLVVSAGSATAGALVTGKRIKDGTVTSADLRNGRGARGVDVRDGSLTPIDFTGSVPGQPGADGIQGIPGLDGIPGWTYRAEAFSVPHGRTANRFVACPEGLVALGGGVSSFRPEDATVMDSSAFGLNGWFVTLAEWSDTTDLPAFVWVICARPS